jgi:hypothetical protein
MTEEYLVLLSEGLIQAKPGARRIHCLLVRLHARHKSCRVSWEQPNRPKDEKRSKQQDQRQSQNLS